ncbi:unnamed protein product [Rhodiola kirilowii]
MSLPDSASVSDPSSHLYPQAIQLKLYQAFIFSIPVLFSIILFLLFYLFYLKRRSLADASASASPSLGLPRTTSSARSSYLDVHSLCQKGLLKEKLKEILPTIPFNEDLKARDTICSIYHPISNTKLIVVGASLPSWQPVYVSGPDHTSQVVLSVANLHSQEHILEVSNS